jgi:beta-N-acetylhexosaminidase
VHRIFFLFLSALLLSACGASTPECDRCKTKLIAPPPSSRQLPIVDKPIEFGRERIALTKAYIQKHYGKTVDDITITPKLIVLHYTAIDSLEASYNTMKPQTLRGGRKDIAKASALNVSVQFLIDKDGTIYRLMPENWMGRHVIGLNYYAIGVENVAKNAAALTPAQVKANIALVKYLKAKYPTIEYLIGHHEYRRMESTPLWLEKDKGYRTVKYDPGPEFMRKVRSGVRELRLKTPPKGK